MQDVVPNGVKVIKANHALQGKVGVGPLDQKVVERCEKVMQENKADFAPLALQYLDELNQGMNEARTKGADVKGAKDGIIAPVMQLKANAKIFDYDLIGNLANVMLSFLEAVDKFDDQVLEIVNAHSVTLRAIVMKNMKGNGGDAGKLMEEELRSVCKRYFIRQKTA
ncbi:MAG: hypothetical protein KTR28_06000 [Micavibrio sp.]|nr:hypothetical protein [Micavibrio sp.]